MLNPVVLQDIALAVAAVRPLNDTLRIIVDGLFSLPHAALVRIWLKGPGDECGNCRMRPECPQQVECLHLAASAGSPRENATDSWDRIDGDFRRFPIGVRKVGRIAKTGTPELLHHIEGQDWIANSAWAEAEEIQSFAGQPLVFGSETFGVLAMFSRTVLSQDELVWLRTFANQAAVAIANARAFDEIADLRRRLELEVDYLRDENKAVGAFGEIIGDSSALQFSLTHVDRVAPTDANVLLLGESGTGKELFARAIHERSGRRNKPMVRVNCAAVPKELFESEFFGHKKGAFTGAVSDRAGRFEVADGGTLFLDEVGEIPLDLQSKLLRVLQEGQFERVGDAKTRTVDVRIVAATNRDLKKESAEGRFREDLYYRLSVFPIELPPLRRRVEDIEALAKHFTAVAAKRFHRPCPGLEPSQIHALKQYPWPGNIRELQSVIDRAVILSDGTRLPLESALPELRDAHESSLPTGTGEGGFVTDVQMRARERSNIVAALEHAGWRVSGPEGAANLLGIKSTTLSSRMRALDISKSS